MASAFYASPFGEAAVVSVDGFGDFVSTMWARGRGGAGWNLSGASASRTLSASYYSGLSQYVGFPKYGDEYKVMGLSAYARW